MAQSSVMGVITQVFNTESGTSKNGNPWVRQTFIVKKITNSQYESFVALDLNSQKNIEAIRPTVGMIGEFFFDAESREGNKPDPQTGITRWFTSLSCYKVKPYQMAEPSPEQSQNYAQQAPSKNNPQGSWNQPQGQYQQAPMNPQQQAPMNPQQGWPQNGGQQGNAPF